MCHQYAPTPSLPAVIIPASQWLALLQQHHDMPSAGHLVFEKTASKVNQVGSWIGMLQDIDRYCRECTVCHRIKLSLQHLLLLH